jgi:glutamate racemase
LTVAFFIFDLMVRKKSPIGFFDSGYGGLTILQEVRKILPEYEYLYLGDNARAPYGTRSFEVVYEYTWQCVKYLLDQGCELVIVACNTASAKALRNIQQRNLIDYPGKRVLGVIRPSAEVIGKMTSSGHVGILATEGTVKSHSYLLEISKFFPELLVQQHACPLWVPLIENAAYHTEEGKGFIRKDVESLLDLDPTIDAIILGCTHYPIVADIIESFIPRNVKVISQGPIVAQALKEYLLRHTWLVKKLSTNRNVHFLTTESSTEFNANAKRIVGWDINAKHITLE